MKNRYSHQLVQGITFGLTTSVITSLGLIAGLYAATASRLAVVSGIAVMAVADGLSDAVSLHTVEEAELDGEGRPRHTHAEVWMTTVFTFLAVALFSLSFVVPVLLFPLGAAIGAAIAWGLLLLAALNYYVARARGESPLRAIAEHVLLALGVVVASHYVGRAVSALLE
jgi:VIT1/CCC1 family predicted Fe2+/Mn2+ transporter